MVDILPVSPAGRRYGRYRDNPVHPARQLFKMSLARNLVLPPKAATSQFMGYIRNQGQEGSCTGQMSAAIRDLLYRSQYQYEKARGVEPADFRASASFVYKCNLIADGDLGQDAGSSIHQSFITLNQKGTCLEEAEPYSDQDYSTAPTDEQYRLAAAYRGGAYHYLPTLYEVKASIASGYSVGLGIDVYSSFEDTWHENGFMPMPDVRREKLLGGHAQHAMDFDDTLRFPDGSLGGLLVQNSWDVDWGIPAPGRSDGGCYWMPYNFVNFGYASDMWMIHLGPAWK